MSDKNKSVNINVSQTIELKNDAAKEKYKELAEQTTKELKRAKVENEALKISLEESTERIIGLEKELEEVTSGEKWQEMSEAAKRGIDIAKKSFEELMTYIRANGLHEIFDSGDWTLNTLAEEVKSGGKSVGQAIAEIKFNFRELLESEKELSSGADLSFLQNITASIERMSEAVSNLEVKIDSMMENGVRTLSEAGGGGTANFAETLNQIGGASFTAGEGAETAYQPIVNLVNAIASYSNIDTDKLQAISSAFRNLAAATSNNLGDKTTNNIIKMLNDLRVATNGEPISISFNVKGIEELKAPRASLRNLAEFLPTIANVNVNKLKSLSDVNLTNFNNLSVSKGAVAEISKIAEAVQILKEAKAASVDISDAGIKIDKSVSQEIEKVDQGLKNVATSAQQVKSSLANDTNNPFGKWFDEYLAKQQKAKVAQDEFYRAATSAGIQSEKQKADAFKAYQQEREAALKKEAQVAEQAAKEAAAAEKQAAKEAAAAEKQAAKEAAAAEKEENTAKKNRITYLKRATTLLNQMQQAEKNWTKAGAIGSKSGWAYQGIKDAIPQLQGYITQVNNGTMSVEDFIVKVNEMNLSFKTQSTEIRAAGENTQTLSERVGKLSSKFGAWLSITRIIMGVIRTIKQMVKAVVEIDSAMTQLQIVTKATNDQMAKFGETAASTSKEIGSTITDFTSSVTTFARLGLT